MTAKRAGNASEMHYDATSNAHHPAAARSRMKPRICACGCGESFRPKRQWQRFKNPQHQRKAWESAHRDSSVLPSLIKKLRAHELRIRALEQRDAKP